MEMLVSDDFEDLCSLLNDHGVEYVIVGGYALAFHGAPRDAAGRPKDLADIATLETP